MYDEKRTIKLDSYDFFGYLAPGTLVLLSTCFCIIQIKYGLGTRASINYLIDKTSSLSNAQFIVLTVFFTIFSYISGHLTSSLSSFIFEKTIVGKVLNFPFKSIVFGQEPDTEFSSQSYRAFISLFFFSIFLFVSGVQRPTLYLEINSKIYTLYSYCITGSILIILILLKILDDPMLKHLPRVHFFYRKALHIIFNIFGILFYTVERFSTHFSGQIKTFPDDTRALLAEKYNIIFGKNLKKELGTEVFWSIYWYTTNNNFYIREKTDKWLILYGFMRNISCSAIIASILVVLPTKFGVPISIYSKVGGITLFLLAIIFSFRYYYIYFGYFSKTIFRAFAYFDFDKPNRPPQLVENDVIEYQI